jgi:hypothetical protein
VIEAKKKMAEGRERKKDCAAVSRKFPILQWTIKMIGGMGVWLHAHLPFTNEKFLCARRRISLSKNTRKPAMESHLNKEEERDQQSWHCTSYHLLPIFRYTIPQTTLSLDDGPPLFTRCLFSTNTRGKAMSQ